MRLLQKTFILLLMSSVQGSLFSKSFDGKMLDQHVLLPVQHVRSIEPDKKPDFDISLMIADIWAELIPSAAMATGLLLMDENVASGGPGLNAISNDVVPIVALVAVMVTGSSAELVD